MVIVSAIMQLFIFALLGCLGHVSIAAEPEYELILAQVIWRHGSRAPSKLYPRNPNTEKEWPFGLGQLTERGMDEAVELGKTLKGLYIDREDPLISPFPVSGEYRIQSTEFDRTMATAAGVAAGLFPKKGGIAAKNYFVPIFANNLTTDADLNVFYSCPRYDEFVDDAFLKLAKIQSDHKWIFDMVQHYTGKNYTLRNIFELYDNYVCDKYENKKPSEWLTPAVIKVIEELVDQELDGLLGLLFDEEEYRKHTRLRGGRILKTFVTHFLRRIECDGVDSPDCAKVNKLRFLGYSAHDITIAHLMTSITRDLHFIVPGNLVDYTGAFSFELWKANGKFVIRILYRPGPDKSFSSVTEQITQMGSTLWDFENFFSYVTPNMPTDFESECMAKNIHIRGKRNNGPTSFLDEKRYPGWDVAEKTNPFNQGA